MAKAAVGHLEIIEAVPYPDEEIRCHNCNMKIKPGQFKLVLKRRGNFYCRLGCANGDLKGQKSFDSQD